MCSLLYKKYNEKWFLAQVYGKLLASNRWWDKNRSYKGYMSWGSENSGKLAGVKESAVSESDLSGTNFFDEFSYNKNSHKLEIASVELMSLYIADCNALAEIAEVLGKEDDKSEILQRAEKYSSALNELWDESSGIYRDKNLLSDQFCQVLAATDFYPLLAGVPNKIQAERMIKEHLLNPEEFEGEYMIPLIAKNAETAVDSSGTGARVLPSLNFLVYLGLKNYDFPEVSKLIAERSLNLVMKEWGTNKRIYREYSSTTGLGSDIPFNDNFYTSGGLLAMIAMIENGYW
jgi:hypothetical protein